MIGCDGDGGYNPPPTQNLEIRTWYDLDAVRGNLTGSYVLMNNLDSATPGYDELASPSANQGKGWEPIGWGYWVSTWFGAKEVGEIFKGSFDGQGYEIRDLYISNSERLVGLFGFIAKGRNHQEHRPDKCDCDYRWLSCVGGFFWWERIFFMSKSYPQQRQRRFSLAAWWDANCAHGTVSKSYSTANVTGNDGSEVSREIMQAL